MISKKKITNESDFITKNKLHYPTNYTFFSFHTVSRLHCESESFKMELILDVNTQAYPVELGRWGIGLCAQFYLNEFTKKSRI